MYSSSLMEFLFRKDIISQSLKKKLQNQQKKEEESSVEVRLTWNFSFYLINIAFEFIIN